MEKEQKTKLSIGTWIGIFGLVAALYAMQRNDMNHLISKIDSFQSEMRDVHGRVSKLEARDEIQC